MTYQGKWGVGLNWRRDEIQQRHRCRYAVCRQGTSNGGQTCTAGLYRPYQYAKSDFVFMPHALSWSSRCLTFAWCVNDFSWTPRTLCCSFIFGIYWQSQNTIYVHRLILLSHYWYYYIIMLCNTLTDTLEDIVSVSWFASPRCKKLTAMASVTGAPKTFFY